jgi:hypothetical protein
MRFLLSLIIAANCYAGLVTISDTLRTPTNGLYSGTVTVALNSPGRAQPLYNSSNQSLTGWQATVRVTNGAFSIQLEANDTITPVGTSYNAKYVPTSGSAWDETWVVPTSGSALPVRTVRSTTTPSPTVIFSPQQISGSGASAGQALIWTGSAVAWQSASGQLTGTAVLDVDAIPDGACILVSTAVTVSGAALGGRPVLGLSSTLPEGVNATARVTGPNSMKAEICNHSGVAYNPPSMTFTFGVNP